MKFQQTGRLRASISNKTVKNTVYIGTNVEYAKYVEYRYPIQSPRPGRETGQMPFLRPALFMSKKEINQLIKRFFKNGGRI